MVSLNGVSLNQKMKSGQIFYETIEQATNAIADYVKFYNTAQVHSSLDYLTPGEFHGIYVNKSQLNVA